MSDLELLEGVLKRYYAVIKILKYDLKQDKLEVYRRDIKEILEMTNSLDKKCCECSDCKKEFETIYDNVNCPYCGSGDVITYG